MRRLLILLLVSSFLPLSVTADDRAELVKGDNAFAVDMYTHLRTQKGNIFFSPESISTALAMTYAGARGDTAQEMATTMHYTLAQEQLHPAMAAFIRDMNAQGKKGDYQLSVVNALWVEQSFKLLPSFIKLNKDSYSAGLNRVDFKTAAETARKTINGWVEKQTNDKIKDLIPQKAVNGMTRLVLTNAVYFKGTWTTPFKKDATKDEDFHVAADKTVTAHLMHRTGQLNYFDDGAFQALELPYKGDDLSMVIFLPKERDGLSTFEHSLTPARLEDWMKKLKPEHGVEVALPKFKMTSTFDKMGDILQAMGMHHAFSDADFTGMEDPKDNNGEGLAISAVIHKAFVDVNEEGTEAAAATAVLMAAGAAIPMGPPPVFRADHPFVFLIRDVKSGSILFMGRVINPTKEAE